MKPNWKMGKRHDRHLTREEIQMTSKFMKNVQYCISLGNRRLKWDNTTHLLEWLKTQNTDDNTCWWECGAIRTLIRCWWTQNGTATLEYSLGISYKTKHILTYNPTNTLRGTYLNELKTYVHTNTCTWMFIGALFIILKIWKQPRGHLVG